MRITPNKTLQWSLVSDNQQLAKFKQAFSDDWRMGLFKLAAEKTPLQEFPSLHYWKKIASQFLTKLCHLSEGTTPIKIDHLQTDEYSQLILASPPMEGGEYLSLDLLRKIWEELNHWTQETISLSGDVASFLQKFAPKWDQIGRVCFHLAENKQNPDRPFAFLATYTSGFSESGVVKHLPLNKAFEQYKNNRAALIGLLTPLHNAAKVCPWVQKLIASNEIYRPISWSSNQAYKFLKTIPELEKSNLSIRVPNWWKKRATPRLKVTIGEQKKSHLGAEEMLAFDAKMALGDENLSESDLQELLSGGEGLVFFKGQWIEVDHTKLQQALDHWDIIKGQGSDKGISFAEGMRMLAGVSLGSEEEEQVDRLHVVAGEGLREILLQLRAPGKLDQLDLGESLKAVPRPYQKEGLSWLHLLTELGLGACLADDMGLGKTIQILMLLLCKKNHSKPSLLVVPASLLANWKSESNRFTPSLHLTFIHPAETPRAILTKIASAPQEHFAKTDLVVTTYSLLSRYEWLLELDWNLVILDEAQAIKNPGTKQTKSVKKLSAHARIALTGTPVENSMGDLWSLFDFLNPGLLGSASVFKSFLKREQGSGFKNFASLRQLISPYILRRMKTDRTIIKDLPDKTEVNSYCKLTKQQVKLYTQVVSSMEEALQKTKGITRKGVVLQSLMRLKQVCNHPSQCLGDGVFEERHSGKFLRLKGLCEEFAERQQKVLIFTQFREIIAPLAEYLSKIFKRRGLVLHGGTPVKQRQHLVKEFQDEAGPPFFILSLKAGGTGLNLTQASHVIHFDRWWNPAIENQATDRAFRIGQKSNVLVHKFITRGTIEEKIDAMIAEKQQLADSVLSGGKEVSVTELDDNALINLVKLNIDQII